MSDYEIHEDQILGEGGMGTVCRGRQISLDRPVAIKIIRSDLTDTPTYVERFRREAELLGQVIDGHVVQVFGAGEWKGRLFYAMEYIEGEDLASRLQRGQVFEIEDILRIAHGVGRALKAAWKYQIVHRDIKPSNILITSDYRVKVADFGLARSLARTPAHTMTIAGTAKYLSPEQGMGDPVDVRSDIYSLGVVLFELATRQAPFDGDSPTSLIYDHVHSQPPSVKDLCPEVRDDVAALIMKCLAKKPEHRFQDPDELLDAVGWIRAQIDPQAVVPSHHRTTKISPPRRLPWLAAVAIGAPIVVAAVAYASWSHFSDDSAQAEQHRKAIDLAIAVGSYEEALEQAKTHFGRESREYLRANRAYRAAQVDKWERQAQAEVSKRNWKETVNAYRVMQEFAEGERKELATAGLAFFNQLVSGQEAEEAGQWERALGIYQPLHSLSQDLRDYLHEATLRVREALAKQKDLEKAETRRQSEQLVQDALKLRSRAEWASALEAARKARDLIKPSEPSPELGALLRELDKAVLAPAGFVFVPSGPFPLGADDGFKTEGPRHRSETGAYYISVKAVTRGDYAKFLEDEGTRLHNKHCHKDEPRGKDHKPDNWTKDLPKNEPVTGVDWYDAVAYSRWAGLRLPTETEWEKAAGYQSDEDRARRYPWGDLPDPDAKDVSFFGVQGMGRGPVEWTQSHFEAYPGSTIKHPDFGTRFRVLRGGVLSSDYATMNSRTSSRHWRLPTDRNSRVGFRCAKDVD
jgi:serine/threonine protein kinase/formylglycine-generating enzyme required for sulfatase activity